MSETVDHVVLIEPSRGWPAPRWRELWEYRDLLRMLVERDFSARYRQTLLGPLWFIVQPLLTTLMFTLIFGRMAGIPTDGLPGPLFYLCGLLGWSYFSQTITVGGLTFVTNAHLFSKVYFPRIVVPAAGAVSNLVATGLQLIPIAIFYTWYALHGWNLNPGGLVLLVPLAFLQLVAVSLAVSLWMSAASAKYRDLTHLNAFLVQLWMFATPVFYPISHVPAPWRQLLLWINPVAAPIEMLKLGLTGHGTFDFMTAGISAALTLFLLASGWLLFSRAERTVTDDA